MTDTGAVRHARVALEQALAARILILDGAIGTMVQRHGLDESQFRGERFADHPVDLKGDIDLLALTRPDVVSSIHAAYLEAGADIIETNTFTSTAVAQADYQLESIVYELNVEAARLARRAPTSGAGARLTDPGSWPARWVRPTSRCPSRRT